jgi:hypothetical protein
MGYTAVIQLVGNFSKVMLSFNFDSWGVKPKSPCWEECCTHKKINREEYGEYFDHQNKGIDLVVRLYKTMSTITNCQILIIRHN